MHFSSLYKKKQLKLLVIPVVLCAAAGSHAPYQILFIDRWDGIFGDEKSLDKHGHFYGTKSKTNITTE